MRGSSKVEAVDAGDAVDAGERIDRLIVGLGDWRGDMLARVRRAILETDPEIFEEWKWMGSPVWSCEGIIAVGNAHKDKVKVTFAQGASLADPEGVFNAGLGGKVWRAVDLFEGDFLNVAGLQGLVRAGVELNRGKRKGKKVVRTRRG